MADIADIVSANLPLTLGLGASLLVILRWYLKNRNLPPGPTGIPILGSALTVGDGNILKLFRDWRRKYGEVFSVKMGNNLLIVVNGYDNIKEVFLKRGDEFSRRPDTFVNNVLGGGQGAYAVLEFIQL